jgi:hypothetical protein
LLNERPDQQGDHADSDGDRGDDGWHAVALRLNRKDGERQRPETEEADCGGRSRKDGCARSARPRSGVQRELARLTEIGRRHVNAGREVVAHRVKLRRHGSD